jgi:predicted SnoaL-like aldol condensation-catalyzing enzyme
MTTTELNKAVVRRFNREFIEQGNIQSLHELVADDFLNHTAAPGVPNDKEGMIYFLLKVLRAGFPDLRVDIFEQIAERDLVTTRKRITGTHAGTIAGIKPTNRKVEIHIMDMVRLRDGKYTDHWGYSNLAEVFASLRTGS